MRAASASHVDLRVLLGLLHESFGYIASHTVHSARPIHAIDVKVFPLLLFGAHTLVVGPDKAPKLRWRADCDSRASYPYVLSLVCPIYRVLAPATSIGFGTSSTYPRTHVSTGMRSNTRARARRV